MNSDAMAARIESLLGLSQPGSAKNCPSPRPPAIPNHEIIMPIGRGSYGEVWLARSVTGALRAVKVVWRCHFTSERPYEREFRGIMQFEPISRSHPGVVNVLHVGRDDAAGCFFYVMELADGAEGKVVGGPTIGKSTPNGPAAPASTDSIVPAYCPHTLASDLKSRGHLPVTEAVSLGVQLAGALGHLHRHGLVHRDVKPSNVIFVGGQPKLADIGLVTRLNEAQSFVGTEGFIPPEGPGSERADLFSLGRLLYETATGKSREDFPGLPDDLDRWPTSEREGLIELNEVLSRACAPEAKKRHGNAAELAGDLNLILAGRSVRRAYRVERRLRRVTWASVAALALVCAMILSNWLQRRQREFSDVRAQREATLREEAQKSLARAEAAERESQQQLYTALLEQARATARSGELGQRVRTLDAVRRAAVVSNSAELRREAFAALGLPDLRFERELRTGPDCTMAVLDPTFERLAVGLSTRTVEIRAVPDQRLLVTLPPPDKDYMPVSGKWSSDGRFLAVRRRRPYSSTSAYTEIWEVASGLRVVSLPSTPWSAFSFHPSEPRVLGADTGNAVSIWDLEEGRKLASFSITGIVHQLEFSPDGRSFLAQHRMGEPWFTTLHDAATGAVRASKLTGWIDGVAWEPHNRWIAFACRTGDIILYDPKTGADSVLGHHKNEARTAAFSPDGDFLFTGGEEREIICWDLRTQRRAFTIGLQSAQIQFPTKGNRCAIATRGSVLLHSLERPAIRELAEDLGGTHRHGAISPDGRWLAASGVARVGLWDLGRESPPAIAVADEFATPFFSPDSSELLAFTMTQFARWTIKSGVANASPPEMISQPVPTTERVYSGHFTSNSLILGLSNGVLVASRTNVAADTARRIKAGGYVQGVVSANGQWLAARMAEVVLSYRLDPWLEVGNVTVGGELVAHAFTPASDELAVASTTGVTFLDTNRWEPQRRLAASLDRNAQLIFTPDGRAFWLARDARYAALHDTRTFETLLPLPIGMIPLAVSPDGSRLVVSVDARRLQVWNLIEVRNQLHALGLDWAEGQ